MNPQKNEIKKVPNLRFQGFNTEWEEKKLREVSESPIYGMNAAAKKYDGKNIYLRITDIDDRTGLLRKDSLTSPDGILEEVYRLKQGDLLFTRTGASTGKTYLYKNSDGNLYFAGFLIKFSIRNADPFFIYLLTLQQRYIKWVKSISMRSGQPGINAKEYSTLKIVLPSLPEQQKISSFLNLIDELLENLRTQTKSLQKYKKGVLQKIFSQEIRFKDDDGKDFPEWEEKRLGDISAFLKGKGISKDDISEDGINKCIRYGELYTEYHELIKEVKSRTNISKLNSFESETNDVLIPSSGETALDIARLSCIKESGILLGGDLNIIRFKKQNGDFFAYYLTNFQNRSIARLAQGNSVVHLYASHLKSLKICVPSFPEQQKIADFLGSIDETIDSKQNQIARVEEWKKGLMQQMFV